MSKSVISWWQAPFRSKSAYLKEARLGSVTAAIQVMGTSAWGSYSLDAWVGNLERVEELSLKREEHIEQIGRDERERWKNVFLEHPEFFKVYTIDREERVTLRWRFAKLVNYDPQAGKVLSPVELRDLEHALGSKEKLFEKLTREPMTPEQVGMLINTAIELHGRAIAEEQTRLAWLPLVGAVLSALGAFGGAFLGKH